MKLNLPKYFELDGKTASMERSTDGGVLVGVPRGMSIADFIQDGRLISKAEFDDIGSKKE